MAARRDRGLHAGRDPPRSAGHVYFDLVRAVKERVPGIHVHAFSPMEILNGATKLGISFREFLAEAKASGLDTIPGRPPRSSTTTSAGPHQGKLPADTWEEIIRTAHGLGIRSSSTIMFGHVDAPPHWVAHIRRLASIQSDTGGFTGIRSAAVRPPQRADLPRREWRDRARQLRGRPRGCTPSRGSSSHGLIHNVQVSWVKLGVEACQRILQSGANDFGGTLMEETISRMAGAEWGIEMTPDRFDDAIRADRACSGGAKYDVRPHRSRLKPPYVEKPVAG